VGVLATAPAALADTATDYAPDAASRVFTPNVGGWTNSTSNDPLCIPPLTCPAASNSYVATGGAFGANDGFIRTSLSGVLGAISVTNRGIWESPTFTYNGDGGATPTSVQFFFARRTNTSALLVNAGNTATYDVDLLPQGGAPGPVSVVNDSPLSPTNGFVNVSAIDIPPAALVIGRSYRIRITTEYRTVATLIPAATSDYDNVILRAATIVGQQGPPGTDGPRGERGPKGERGPRGQGNNKGLSPEDRALKNALRNLKGKIKAKRTGRRTVKAKLFCPKKNKVDEDCRFQTRVQVNRFGERLSKTEKVRIKPGKSKNVNLRLLGNRTDELDGRGRVTLSSVVRSRIDGQDAKVEVFYRPKIKNNDRFK
jgi:hypothetical protein